MSPYTRSVVIVGGGVAGWMTAAIIAARHGNALKVTLIESPDVRTIGVGEGTWPTLRATLKKIGVSETDFLRQCDASFKQGSQFVGWVSGDAENDTYYHPFTPPAAYEDCNLAPYWQDDPAGLSFADAVGFQPTLCVQGLAPKQITTPEFAAIANYAYHLDAGKFSTFLRDHCVEKLGVSHILANVTQIESDKDGYITILHSDSHAPISGDLFIDCTGFLALLIGKHYGAPLKSCTEHLFIDTALAVQVPYSREDSPIASVTISTAQRAGWIWDVGLTKRRGVGHVYASRFSDEDQAVVDLKTYLGQAGKVLNEGDIRKIAITAGYRETGWVKNAVAVGLSSGFVEPLEASSIVMVELSAQMIADQMPVHREVMPVIAARFNEAVQYRWQRIIDFLKLHYVLSHRAEPFWRANRDPASVPDSLKDLLGLWRYHFPWHDDLVRKDEIFPSASYQYVLYGMGFETRPGLLPVTPDTQRAQALFRDMARARQAAGQLPGHRDLLNRIQTYGLQRV